MKRVNRVLLCLGLAFLAYLVAKVGPGELLKQMSALGWGILLLIAVEGLANLAHTLGWRHCVAEPGEPVPLFSLLRMWMAGFAISYLTPTASMGGDVSRITLLASFHQTPRAISSVLVDKVMTGIAQLLLVILGAVFLVGRVSLPGVLWALMALLTALLAAGMGIFVLLQKHGKLGALCRWLVKHRLGGRAVKQAALQLSNVDEALRQFYLRHPRSLVRSIGWHMLGHSTALVQAGIVPGTLRPVGALINGYRRRISLDVV
jgi:uncharacterized membrane protein YbhN (UPF0104 family)